MTDKISYYNSPLGRLLLATDGNALIGLWFEGQEHYAETLSQHHDIDDNHPLLQATSAWLDAYFDGKHPPIDIPVNLRLSPFRSQVCLLLAEIPYGTTITYGILAHRIAFRHSLQSMSAQAIGGAVAHNPVSILLPCHRVVASNGKMTGYSAGIQKKQWLLRHEGIIQQQSLQL